MAVSVYAFWEVRAGGAATNSGVFDANATTNATLTSGNATSVFPTVSTPNYSFTNRDVGNYLYVKGGTNWNAGWFQITGLAGTSAIVNANKDQWTLANGQMGYLNGVGIANTISSGSWTIDYTLNNNASITYTDLNLITSTVFQSTLNPVTPAIIGNSIRITGGTGFSNGIYWITSATGTSATLDRVAGTQGSTGGQAYLGGALPDLHTACIGVTQICPDKTFIFVNGSSPYTVNTGSGVSSLFTTISFVGYGSTRGDNGKATFNISSNSRALFLTSGSSVFKILNINFNGSSNPESYAIATNFHTPWYFNCDFTNLTGSLVGGLTYGLVKNCSNPNFYILQYATVASCASTASAMFTNATVRYSLLKNNTINTGNLINYTSANHYSIMSNIFYNNSCRFLINNTPSAALVVGVQDNIFAGNASTIYGPLTGYTSYMYDIFNNAYFNNTYINNEPLNVFGSPTFITSDEIILTENPFFDPANDNFTINNKSGGGLLLRNKKVIPLANYNSQTPRNGNVSFIQNNAIPLHLGTGGGFRG